MTAYPPYEDWDPNNNEDESENYDEGLPESIEFELPNEANESGDASVIHLPIGNHLDGFRAKLSQMDQSAFTNLIQWGNDSLAYAYSTWLHRQTGGEAEPYNELMESIDTINRTHYENARCLKSAVGNRLIFGPSEMLYYAEAIHRRCLEIHAHFEDSVP